MSRIVVLLPSRNEEDGIGEVIDRIPVSRISELGYQTEIVVIDGGSTDSTREIALDKGARVLKQNGTTGKGNGVREALQYIFNSGEIDSEFVIMMDSDATYNPEDLPRFIGELGDVDVVWGSRLRGKIEKNAMSRINKMGNVMLSLAASVLYFKRTTDLCTGYWGFRSSALKDLKLVAEGFNLEADLFASVSKSKLTTREIAIDYAHREGQSNLTWYTDGPRILLMTFRRRFS